MERMKPVHVEELLNEFIVSAGGNLLVDLIKVPDGTLNADYVFQQENTIIELKTLQKDMFGDAEDATRLLDLLASWQQKGLIEVGDKLKYVLGSKRLPTECWKDVVNKALKAIERAIHHANKQLISSKKLLKMPTARSVVLLVNDGNYFFSNEQILAAICQVWARKFGNSQLDCIIYLTINQVSKREGSDLDWQLWSPIYGMTQDVNLVSFVNSLGAQFNSFFASFTVFPTSEYQVIDDPQEVAKLLADLVYLPKNLIYRK